jgi:glucosamine--fructose-6-phosphate aminotransferase (isomerizing)
VKRWRIGDGTASFYNYIYYAFAGFTESDTFRSNQIRAGLIGREDGLAKVIEENRPRSSSIEWYCDVIGISFNDAIKRINAAAAEWHSKSASINLSGSTISVT